MRLRRESAAWKREEEVERIGELVGAGDAEEQGRMAPERRAYRLEFFRPEAVRGDYLSAASSAARSSAGLTRPLCLKTSAPERS